jgi:hypothetical protein
MAPMWHDGLADGVFLATRSQTEATMGRGDCDELVLGSRGPGRPLREAGDDDPPCH